MPQTHLQLNLGFGNILLAAAAVRNLLGLSDLGTDSLRAEVLQGVTLDGVDAQLRVRLDNGETARHCHPEAIVSWIYLPIAFSFGRQK